MINTGFEIFLHRVITILNYSLNLLRNTNYENRTVKKINLTLFPPRMENFFQLPPFVNKFESSRINSLKPLSIRFLSRIEILRCTIFFFLHNIIALQTIDINFCDTRLRYLHFNKKQTLYYTFTKRRYLVRRTSSI